MDSQRKIYYYFTFDFRIQGFKDSKHTFGTRPNYKNSKIINKI